MVIIGFRQRYEKSELDDTLKKREGRENVLHAYNGPKSSHFKEQSQCYNKDVSTSVLW